MRPVPAQGPTKQCKIGCPVKQMALVGRQVSGLVRGGSHEMQPQHDAASPTCRVLNLAAVFRLTVNVNVHGGPNGDPSFPETVPLDHGFVDTDGVARGHERRPVVVDRRDQIVEQRPAVPLAACVVGGRAARLLSARSRRRPHSVETVARNARAFAEGGSRNVLRPWSCCQ